MSSLKPLSHARPEVIVRVFAVFQSILLVKARVVNVVYAKTEAVGAD